MDIKFIWIKEHRLLKNLNFNFCHDGVHEFKYEDKRINIVTKQEFPINFGENITNITGIAGKNGSGKSSFCEIVLASIATLQNGSFGYNSLFDGIVCFGDHFFIQNDLKVTNEAELTASGYSIQRYKDSPFEEMKHEWRNSFVKDGFIYYSNFLDRKSAQGENNLVNISTQSCLLEDGYYSTYPIYRLRTGESNDETRIDKFTQYETHVVQEDFRNLRFITKFPNLVPFIGNHTSVALHPSYSGNNRFVSPKDPLSKIGECICDYEKEIFNEVYPFYSDKKNEQISYDSEDFKKLILRLYKLNIVAITYNSEVPNISSDDIRKFIFEEVVPNYLNGKNIRELIDTYQKLLSIGEMSGAFNPQTWQWNYRKTRDWRYYVLQYVTIPLNLITIPLFEKLIDLEDEILDSEKYTVRRISNYTIYPYFSSGQASYLSLFSRLYDVILRNEKGYDDRKKLILFLDEPDVGFHPEWSRSFLNRLVNYLNLEFNKFKFQIILTTHSPYILSDLPSENVQLFNQIDNSKTSICKPNSNTFGANIYDLFRDSFFMEKGFIGEFAKQKIDDVFEDLSKGEEHISDARKIAIEQIIRVIGEPLIKRQLSKMYDDIYNTDLEIEAIDQQIKRLEEFKNRKKKTDNDKDK